MRIVLGALVAGVCSELAFVLALLPGYLCSSVVALMLRLLLSALGRPSIGRALFQFIGRAVFQGAVVGPVAGVAALWVSVRVGGHFALPPASLLWIAFTGPALGEFGDFLRRSSLRNTGRPNTGVLAPLGRLHGAAKAMLMTGVYEETLLLLRGHGGQEDAAAEPDDTQARAARIAVWFIDVMSWGLAVGALASMLWLAMSLRLPFYSR